MAKFFVGQRVRIVNVDSPRCGCEGTVVRFSVSNNTVLGIGEWIEVDVDGWGRRDPSDGLRFAYATFQLEPILPSGHVAGDYSLSELLDHCRAGEGIPA